MFRSYRLLFLAIAGLILIGVGQPPKTRAHPPKSQSYESVARQAASTDIAAPKQPIASRPDEGCEQGDNRRDSDLCAQWKAADAATDAAKAAWWQFWLGTVGLILGAVTMAAAIAAAWYAKRAAKATEDTVEIARNAAAEAGNALAIAGRNADAAVKLADQAEINAERQLRGYVSVRTATFFHETDGSDYPILQLSIRNHGQTPVHIVSCNVSIDWYCDKDNVVELFGENNRKLGFDLFPSDPIQLPFGLTAEGELLERTGLIMVVGRIDYRDVFDANDFTGFMFKSAKASDLFDVEHGGVLSVMPYPHGNKRQHQDKR